MKSVYLGLAEKFHAKGLLWKTVQSPQNAKFDTFCEVGYFDFDGYPGKDSCKNRICQEVGLMLRSEPVVLLNVLCS